MSEEQNVEPQEEAEKKEELQAEPEGKKEFSFIQEIIKEERPSGKRLLQRAIRVAGLGLVFGLAACCAFYALKPWAELQFKDDPNEVTIPADEDEDTAVEDQTAETLPAELTIDSYKELNLALYQVAAQVNKSVVEVTATLEGESWIETSYDTMNSVSGLFVADNGQEVLILTYSSILERAAGLQVTFVDNQVYSASLKKKDENLGLAVVSIPRTAIKQNTWAQIETAVLGNSNTVTKGEGVIAVGKQYGYSSGQGYGVMSSTRNSVPRADGEYHILCTDMAAAKGGTGILANYQGEIIGLIDQRISSEESMNLVTAYAISDLKSAVEDLSNGKAVPYMGIWGIDVTEALAEQQGIPQGVYIKEVNSDSPAMEAGIKSGDIIMKFGKEDVANLSAYHRELMACENGQVIKVSGQRLGPDGYVDINFEVVVGSKE